MNDFPPESPETSAVPEAIGPLPAARKINSIDLSMDFTGKPTDYLILLLKTTFLTIVTLGLYYPWARAERLRFLMNHTQLGSHFFSFTGTGKEIAVGYIKAFLLYGLLYAGIYGGGFLQQMNATMGLILSAVALLLFYGFLPLIIWGAKAYRLSRIRYRSIYFSMDHAQRKNFLLKTLRDFFFSFISLGFYIPVFKYNLTRNLIQATRWGNLSFDFNATRGESYRLSMKNFLLTIFTFGLYGPFALANRINFTANHTRVGKTASLRTSITGVDILLLLVVPLVVTTLTLGLAFPWASLWARKNYLKLFSILGEIDLADVRQDKDRAGAAGETIGDLWNVDMSFGV